MDKMKLDFEKMGGLVPAIVQDNNTSKVLMLGFMNEEAYEETVSTGKVTFFSRTKNRLWMKGETSGNTLQVVSILPDCDNDTLLIKAIPAGPVCHTGADTCFGEKNEEDIMFLKYLQSFIERRRQEMPEGSQRSRSRSRIMPPPKESGSEHLTLPPYSVRIWWDYSHRYGLAYLLRNSVCGACFNDFSRILLTPDETLAQYWETPQTPQPEIVSLVGIDESPLKKKLLLIKHFATELKQRVKEMEAPPLKINMPTDVIAHVKYWARTKEGILFRMANRDIQANFKDHTKLVIESQSKKMYFDTGKGVKVLALADLSDREKNHDVRKRFVLVKEMAKHLV